MKDGKNTEMIFFNKKSAPFNAVFCGVLYQNDYVYKEFSDFTKPFDIKLPIGQYDVLLNEDENIFECKLIVTKTSKTLWKK